ncbi:Serine/threonine-protein kinase/endoribonuclease IRE2 [Orchesella cincta]|uniref:Serine/threonine-protein kinase/endoribonuclease IRE2 n=1 Tax=Orchesella cincta TaxID=48709 RepID=A0A1D2MBI4_ORCCI|nr:Serine/threonine-protein kinase/endoribonuclease IRE2 [Orchesella cincta]
METWEQKQITDNLNELIRLTFCTSSVLAYLVSKRILSADDCSVLRAITMHHEQSFKLYEILLTKTNGYSELHKVLQTENQTGASDILERGFLEQGPLQITKRIEYDRNINGCAETGKFYKGKFGGRDVAVKEIDIKLHGIKIVWNEVKLLLKSDAHENIIRYLTIERKDDYTLMALEQCITTLQRLFKSPQDNRPNIVSTELLRQATLGVAHLHSLHIVHGNLKPENVVLCDISTNVIRVKITDFRAGKSFNDEDILDTCRSSLLIAEGVGWMAPEIAEILDNTDSENYSLPRTVQNELNAKMTYASDIFSLGCIFYFVMTGGQHPFGTMLKRQCYILDKQYKIDSEINSTLVRRMTEYDAVFRPQAAELLTDAMFM